MGWENHLYRTVHEVSYIDAVSRVNVTPLGPVELIVLSVGFALMYATSQLSPLKLRHRFSLALLSVLAVFCVIPHGFATVKGLKHAFLFGEGKAAIFYSWAFGIWFSLVLLRSKSTGLHYAGWLLFCLFVLLVTWVISSEFDLLMND